MNTDDSALIVRHTRVTERIALSLEVPRDGPAVMDFCQLPPQDTTPVAVGEDQGQGPGKDIMGEIRQIRMIFSIENCVCMCVQSSWRWEKELEGPKRASGDSRKEAQREGEDC